MHEATVYEGNELIDALGTTVDTLEEAIRTEVQAAQTKREAAQMYEALEAEVVFELMLGIDGKNAEARKAALDAQLVQERVNGRLSSAWKTKLATENRHANALAEREIASVRHNAVRRAAYVKAELAHLIADR